MAFPAAIKKMLWPVPNCRLCVTVMPVLGSSILYDPAVCIPPPILMMEKSALKSLRHETLKPRKGSSIEKNGVGVSVAVSVGTSVAVSVAAASVAVSVGA